ncbi:hypothetical protein HDV06_006662 [Boothiomyces sp. JEL0866]|nr:hypothetical protein HDV06_006662 [Boothiomyces sp. JEL0866]
MIDTKNILDLCFNIANFGIAGLSIYLLYKINYRKAHVKSFKKRFNVILAINLIQCSMFVFIFLMSYVNDEVYIVNRFYVNETVAIISNIETCFILLIDIEILRIYSVLNSRITDRKINMFRNFVVGMFILFPFTSHIMYIVFRTSYTSFLGNVCIALFSIFVVVYDNLQNIYLALLIYKFKDTKYNHELTDEMLEKFREITKFNVAIVTLDWSAVSLYGIFIIFASKNTVTYLATYSNYGSIFCICLHSLGLVYILKMLKDFAVSKKAKRFKTVVVDLNTTQQVLNSPVEAHQMDTQILPQQC